jgi:putative effector of murein hydrolase
VVVFAATAYLVRGLQILFGTSKKATTERAEEMGAENDEIPLTQRERPDPAFRRPVYSTHSHTDSLPEMPAPAQEPPHPRDPSSFALPPETPTQHTPTTTILRQDPLPPTRPQRWAASIATHLDTLTYLVLFLAIGLPTYYFLDYAMPAHLTLSVLAYFLASSLPRHTTRILHPVLVSSALTILAIYLLSRTTGTPLPQALSAYTTGTKYLTLFTPAPAPAGPARPRPLPGAGDVLGSLLDAGIAALALPMFQYRHELRRHLAAIAIPCTALAAASLFAYPALCAAVGIAPERSLAFAARSLTLALAGPAVANLGGDASLVAVLCIMSGILGVLVGPTLLTWLRIPDGRFNSSPLFSSGRRSG